MNVAELRTILEHLPDDIEVHIHASPGATCHVQRIIRHGTIHNRTPFGLDGARWTTRVPGHVQLDTGFDRVGWWREPPPVELCGAYRDRAGLDEQLLTLGWRS